MVAVALSLVITTVLFWQRAMDTWAIQDALGDVRHLGSLGPASLRDVSPGTGE